MFSRHLEHEADCFALELTRDNRSAATAFVRLQNENLSNPMARPRSIGLFRASHPSLAERIEFANDYRPWEQGAAAPLRRPVQARTSAAFAAVEDAGHVSAAKRRHAVAWGVSPGKGYKTTR